MFYKQPKMNQGFWTNGCTPYDQFHFDIQALCWPQTNHQNTLNDAYTDMHQGQWL